MASSFQVCELNTHGFAICNKVKALDNIYIRQDVNIIRRLTKGYSTMYSLINGKVYHNNIKSNFRTITNDGNIIYLNNDENITLPDGWINNNHNNGLGLTTKILNTRYEIIKMIDLGTFSQIYEAKDLYFSQYIQNKNSTKNDFDSDLGTKSARNVVIKVLRRGYHQMGIREHLFLQYFSSMNNHSNDKNIYFCSIKNSLSQDYWKSLSPFAANEMKIENNFSTLFDFLCRPYRPSPSPTQFHLTLSSNITNQPIENTNVVPIIHPRVLRGEFAKQKLSQLFSPESSQTSVTGTATVSTTTNVTVTNAPEYSIDSNLIKTKSTEQKICETNVLNHFSQQFEVDNHHSNKSQHVLSDSENVTIIKKLAFHLISMLCVLKNDSIIHCDLKPENIFIYWNMEPKLRKYNNYSFSSNNNDTTTSQQVSNINNTTQYTQNNNTGITEWHQPYFELKDLFYIQYPLNKIEQNVIKHESLVTTTTSASSSSSTTITTTPTSSTSVTVHTTENNTTPSKSRIQNQKRKLKDLTESIPVHPSISPKTPAQPIIQSKLHRQFQSPEIVLGDMGNSIHMSEVVDYYDTFELQSLPYRAPEVLLGLPFNTQIDIWSVGVILIELILKKPLFLVTNRSELFNELNSKFGPFPTKRFSGGKYSSLLYSTTATVHSDQDKETLCGSNQLLKIKNLLFPQNPEMLSEHINKNMDKIIINQSAENNIYEDKNVIKTDDEDISNSQDIHYLLHFLAGLLQLDPDVRLTPYEALNHPYLSCIHNLPGSLMSNMSLLSPLFNQSNSNSTSVASSGVNNRNNILTNIFTKRQNNAKLSLKKLRQYSK